MIQTLNLTVGEMDCQWESGWFSRRHCRTTVLSWNRML